MRSALLLSMACMLSTPVWASTAESPLVEEQIITAESSYPATNSQFGQRANVTSAADLSLFGILALGIIGLLWVRKHTSEL